MSQHPQVPFPKQRRKEELRRTRVRAVSGQSIHGDWTNATCRFTSEFDNTKVWFRFKIKPKPSQGPYFVNVGCKLFDPQGSCSSCGPDSNCCRNLSWPMIPMKAVSIGMYLKKEEKEW
eukprot:235141_1